MGGSEKEQSTGQREERVARFWTAGGGEPVGSGEIEGQKSVRGAICDRGDYEASGR